ncbi:MAG: hypothetical protein WC860_01890 [Candidatus Margulisiibacteriota bacterium]|jgi:hypothetical protein
MKKILLITLLIVMGLASFAQAFGKMPTAPERPPFPPDGPPMMLTRLINDLKLTEQQKLRFLEQSKEIEKQAIDLKYENIILKEKIENELAKDAPNSKLIYEYMQKLDNNFLKMRFARINNIIELKKDLNQEQKKMFIQIMKKEKMHHKKEFQGWHEKEGKKEPRIERNCDKPNEPEIL